MGHTSTSTVVCIWDSVSCKAWLLAQPYLVASVLLVPVIIDAQIKNNPRTCLPYN